MNIFKAVLPLLQKCIQIRNEAQRYYKQKFMEMSTQFLILSRQFLAELGNFGNVSGIVLEIS